MNVTSRGLAALIGFFALSAGLLVPAVAALDRCTFATQASGAAAEEKFQVELNFDEEQRNWNFICRADQKEVASGEVEGLQFHAHPEVYVAPAGDRFVVFDPQATTRNSNRLFVFDFAGQLLKSYGVTDLLTEQEQSKVQRSRSHLSWVVRDEAHRLGKLSDSGKSFAFVAVGGRAVEVPLYEAEDADR